MKSYAGLSVNSGDPNPNVSRVNIFFTDEQLLYWQLLFEVRGKHPYALQFEALENPLHFEVEVVKRGTKRSCIFNSGGGDSKIYRRVRLNPRSFNFRSEPNLKIDRQPAVGFEKIEGNKAKLIFPSWILPGQPIPQDMKTKIEDRLRQESLTSSTIDTFYFEEILRKLWRFLKDVSFTNSFVVEDSVIINTPIITDTQLSIFETLLHDALHNDIFITMNNGKRTARYFDIVQEF